MYDDLDWTVKALDDDYTEGEHYIEFDIGPHGFFDKPCDWTSRRSSPGKIQQAISEYIMAHTRLRQALNDSQGAKNDLDKAIRHFDDFWDCHRRNLRLSGGPP